MRDIIIPLNPIPNIDLIQEIHTQLQCLSIQDIYIENEIARARTAIPKTPFSKVIKSYNIGHTDINEVVHHSAALLAWMPLVKRKISLIVIHVDRHSDLGMPNLLRGKNHTLYDRWTGMNVVPDCSDSVRNAIDSTAIEIGSYLTLALYWLPVIGLIWIYPKGTYKINNRMNWIKSTWSGIDPLNSNLRRLHADKTHEQSKAIRFFGLPNGEGLDSVIRQFNSCTDILLDIDLDYFDNRMENSQSLLPDTRHSQEGIDNHLLGLFKIISTSISPNRLNSLTISQSPGFCPEKSAAYLVQRFEEILPSWL